MTEVSFFEAISRPNTRSEQLYTRISEICELNSQSASSVRKAAAVTFAGLVAFNVSLASQVDWALVIRSETLSKALTLLVICQIAFVSIGFFVVAAMIAAYLRGSEPILESEISVCPGNIVKRADDEAWFEELLPHLERVERARLGNTRSLGTVFYFLAFFAYFAPMLLVGWFLFSVNSVEFRAKLLTETQIVVEGEVTN